MARPKHTSIKTFEHRKFFLKNKAPQIIKIYQNELKQKYQDLYISSKAKNNEFYDSSLFQYVNRVLNKNNGSDYLIENDIELLLDYQMKFLSQTNREKKKEKNPNHYHLHFPFYETGIPVKIREMVKDKIEIYEEYYKQCIYSFLEKFYIRGSVSEMWVYVDQIYRNGFNRYIDTYKSPYGNKSREQIERSYNLTEEFSKSFWVHTKDDLFAKYNSLGGHEFNVRLLRFNFNERRYGETVTPHYLTMGLNLNPIEYLPNNKNLEQYINADYAPRNRVRDLLGLPKIGEGWISETKLFYQIREYFPNEVVSQHYKPKWLGRQHFDIYFPMLNIAIEYQGKQHYEPIDFFGGKDAFEKNVKRDALKLKKSTNNNCDLIFVNPGYIIEDVVNEIMESNNFNKTI